MIELLSAKDPGEALGIVSKINSKMEVEQLLLHPDFDTRDSFSKAYLLGENNSDTDKQMAIDYLTYMVDDILHKVDRTTMAVSLEGREPLLDHRLVEFMATIPAEIKMKGGEKKHILKQVVHKYIPENKMDRPKKGFALPVFEWFKEDLKVFIRHYLDEEKIARQGLLNPAYVRQVVQEYEQGKMINAQKIWLLLAFQMWYNEWMD